MATPQWISVDQQLGLPAPGIVDSGHFANGLSGTLLPAVAVGTIRQFRDISSLGLGDGEFIFLPGVASTGAGDVVNYSISNGAANGGSTTRWAGTANTGLPLAVATAATVASTWGWYQIGGATVVNTNGTVAAGNPMYWQATATISATAVAGKQMEGATAASANGVPATNQSIITLNRPSVQGQIT